MALRRPWHIQRAVHQPQPCRRVTVPAAVAACFLLQLSLGPAWAWVRAAAVRRGRPLRPAAAAASCVLPSCLPPSRPLGRLTSLVTRAPARALHAAPLGTHARPPSTRVQLSSSPRRPHGIAAQLQRELPPIGILAEMQRRPCELCDRACTQCARPPCGLLAHAARSRWYVHATYASTRRGRRLAGASSPEMRRSKIGFMLESGTVQVACVHFNGLRSQSFRSLWTCSATAATPSATPAASRGDGGGGGGGATTAAAAARRAQRARRRAG